MSATTPSGNGASAGKADYDALKADLKALRADLAALVNDTGKIASEEAKRQTVKARALADDAGKKATEYRDIVEDKVRDHPFAAIGIALAAGFVVASMARRR
jgi:ElaB/YqjD/DUF883 family membrane-anchored ribosome-binding protein